MTRADVADQGANDQYGTLAQVEAIERGVQGPVQRAVLECRHAPHLEAPDETLAARGGVPAVSGLEQHFVIAFERSFDVALRPRVPVLRRTGGVNDEAVVLGAGRHRLQSGIYAAIAESLASTGTAVEVVPQGSSRPA